jgi:hypothetical protein
MKNIYALLVIVLILPGFKPRAQAPRNYLSKVYAAKGRAASLTGITKWRDNEQKNIRQAVQELPADIRQKLLDNADAELKRPWAVIQLSDYMEYKINGDRVKFEKLYFDRRIRLARLVIADLVSPQEKYINEVANGLWLIMEESTWVLPAHTYLQKAGDGPPDPEERVIDLFAGETSSHLSWIKLLLKPELDKISPLIVKRIDVELNTRIVEPYLKRNDLWWMGFTGRKPNNWNIWVNTNILRTALLAVDNNDARLRIIEKSIRSADIFVNAYPNDGGCDEGPSYWAGAGGCLGEYLSLLTEVSGGKLNWKRYPLIHNIGTYIYKAHIDSTRFMNFADASASAVPQPSRILNFGNLYDDALLKGFASYANHLAPASGIYGATVTAFAANLKVRKQLEAITPKAPQLKDNWLPDLQVLMLRENAGSKKEMTFMAKGGNNGESHNHNDIGNFMIYQDGAPVLIDIGKGTYSKQTFSDDRYQLYNMQSAWHNCPTINGVDQHEGAAFKASNVSYVPGVTHQVFVLDLAGAYPATAGVNHWIRKFDYQPGVDLTLTEKYDLKQNKEPFALRFIACKPAKIDGNGIIILSNLTLTSAIKMEYDPTLLEASVEEKPTDDTSIAKAWGPKIYRIVLKSKSAALKGEVVVKFSKQ